MSNKQRLRKGLMLILSGPSGAGKTVLGKQLLQENPSMRLSVSATTRQPRKGEVDGVDYQFMSHDRFKAMIKAGEFLEYAKVYGEYYGTPRASVRKAVESGQDLLFDIDWQGAQQLAQMVKDDLVQVFVLPPSVQELKKRLFGRGQDSAEEIERRMTIARNEISHWSEYHYVIINDDLDEAMRELRQIHAAEQNTRYRQPWLIDFVRDLT